MNLEAIFDWYWIVNLYLGEINLDGWNNKDKKLLLNLLADI